jgi:hypothetical protein
MVINALGVFAIFMVFAVRPVPDKETLERETFLNFPPKFSRHWCQRAKVAWCKVSQGAYVVQCLQIIFFRTPIIFLGPLLFYLKSVRRQALCREGPFAPFFRSSH